MIEGRHIRILGRVQGVGFRAFVVRLAADYDIVGEVWNCRDGAVEVHAYHASSLVLAEFEQRLKHGPGRVDGVLGAVWETNEAPANFCVGHTR